MNNILPKNSLCAKLLPQSQDSIRFLKNFTDSQEANYEVLESKTNKIWTVSYFGRVWVSKTKNIWTVSHFGRFEGSDGCPEPWIEAIS